MILSLRASEIDLAVGLTEGWVAGLLSDANRVKGGYKIVGSWCRSPLRWAVVTGRNRQEINTVGDLARNRKVGVSRMGSGSHVMATVLAEREGWLKTQTGEKKELEFVPLGPFKELRDGVTGFTSTSTSNTTTATGEKKAGEKTDDQPDPRADFFMWEHFTTKPYFAADDAPLKWIGEIYTPWPSWHIAASTSRFPDPQSDETLDLLFRAFDKGMAEFRGDEGRVVRMLGDGSAKCHYSEEDAREWLKSVEFFEGTKGVERGVMRGVVDVLKGAGVISESVVLGEDGDWGGVIGVAR